MEISKPQNDYSSKKRYKSKKNTCALCNTNLYQTSYSNHYCRSNIPIESDGIIKAFLRKSCSVRQKYPNVQHVWADPNPSNTKEYLLKIKAPLSEIDDFVSDLKVEIVFIISTFFKPISQRNLNLSLLALPFC